MLGDVSIAKRSHWETITFPEEYGFQTCIDKKPETMLAHKGGTADRVMLKKKFHRPLQVEPPNECTLCVFLWESIGSPQLIKQGGSIST